MSKLIENSIQNFPSGNFFSLNTCFNPVDSLTVISLLWMSVVFHCIMWLIFIDLVMKWQIVEKKKNKGSNKVFRHFNTKTQSLRLKFKTI